MDLINKNKLIIITGLAGTGKTNFGKKIANEFKLPFLSKDNFKEIIFDVFNFKDREMSKKTGMVSYDILYHVLEENLKSNITCIVETNFDPNFANKKFLDFKEKYNLSFLQIRFICNGDVLLKRFIERASSSERHVGHGDLENLAEFEPILKKGEIEILDIGSDIINIDTTDFNLVDFDKILKEVNKFLIS